MADANTATKPAEGKTKRKRAPIDPNESRDMRFMRIARPRVKKALKSIKLIGNCFNRGSYDFSPEQGEKIILALEDEIKVLRSKMKEADKSEPDFTF